VVHPAPLDGIRIELHDRRVIYPRRVWSDRTTDIAVLEVDCTDLISVPLADSDRLEIGDFVLAIGSPFGLSRSVTYGIVSAKGRRNLELGSREIEIQDFIQTDAAINPGNSGGPLMNLRGELVGINTAIASNSGGSEGIGFAIPINLARSVAEQLIARGQVARGYLGVQMDKGFDASAARRLGLSRSEGALIKVVKPNSPAERAGIRVGDVIVSFDQTRVENDDHLLQLVGLTPVGRTVSVELVRDRQLRRINLRLAEFPADL
jgi:serine protease Do